jgi:hypothetical protein
MPWSALELVAQNLSKGEIPYSYVRHSNIDFHNNCEIAFSTMLILNLFRLLPDFERPDARTQGNICGLCRIRQSPKWSCQVCGLECCAHRRARQKEGVVCKPCRNELLADITTFLKGE